MTVEQRVLFTQHYFQKLKLNPVQEEAVFYEGGPELVFAGAGTGKTQVLTAKIAFLIQQKRIPPFKIFAATFTNKAARGMRDRVERLTGVSCDGLWIGTFHSLCVRILRREAARIGYTSDFSIFDRDDQLAVAKNVLKELDIDERRISPRQVLEQISRAKSACISPDESIARASGFYDKEIARVFEAYCKSLVQQHAMDFDDLITNTVYLFRNDPATAQKYRDSFDYILVDEYQDTNIAQFQLIRHLVGSRGCIFVVGDDDQSIYGWRGAHIENILTFDKVFPGTKVFKLEQNYRSTQSILDFAHAAIAPSAQRAEKKLWTESDEQSTVVVTKYRDDRQEAEAVCLKLKKLIETGMTPEKLCVLFRTNAQSRVFEGAFRKFQLPYVLVGTTGFYERKEIKDCLAYMKLLVNPMDNVSFDRIVNVPARGLGQKAQEAITSLSKVHEGSKLKAIVEGDIASLGTRCKKGCEEVRRVFTDLFDLREMGDTPVNLLKTILTESGYMDMLEEEGTVESEGRIENVNELLNAVQIWSDEHPGEGLDRFLEEITLSSEVDSWEQKDRAVNLMTLHCAKGLEFDAVFLVGLEDGLLPSKLNFDDARLLEEERRLLYVGITRAKTVLECSFVQLRWRFGSVVPMMPSRFLSAISRDWYVYHDEPGSYEPVVQERPVPQRTRSYGAQPQPASRTAPSGVLSPRAPATTARPKPPAAPDPEGFSQETVQYRIGQYVTHGTYGRGRVVNLSGFGKDLRLTILFDDGARRKLMAEFAKLDTKY